MPGARESAGVVSRLGRSRLRPSGADAFGPGAVPVGCQDRDRTETGVTEVTEVEESMLTEPMTAEYLIDHVGSSATLDRHVQLSVDSPDRAVTWIRVQARGYGATAPEDHPIWDWIDHRYHRTEAELRMTGSATVFFELDYGTVSWNIRVC